MSLTAGHQDAASAELVWGREGEDLWKAGAQAVETIYKVKEHFQKSCWAYQPP